MSILLIGDVHFKNDNVFQCKQLFDQVRYLLDTRNIKHVILLGDIMHYHEKIYTAVMNLVLEFIKMIPVPITILVGNHDMINNQVFCDPTGNWLGIFDGWANVNVIHVPQYVYIEGLKIAAVPYVYPGRFKEALDLFNIDLNQADFCMAHQEFKGCQMKASLESNTGDDYIWKTPCYSGHIHGHHIIKNIVYTGSAFEHTFGAPKCWLFLIDINTKRVEKIESSVESKQIFYVQLSDDLKVDMRIPSNATPQLYKCVLQIDNVVDYNTWLQSLQGQEFSKRFSLGYILKNEHKEPDYSQVIPDLIKCFVESISIRYPDCTEMLNSLY